MEPVHGAVMERSNHGTIQRKGASVSLITEAPRAWIAHLRPHGAWGNVRGAAAPKPPQHGGPGNNNFIEAAQSPQTLKDSLPLPFIRYTHAKPPAEGVTRETGFRLYRGTEQVRLILCLGPPGLDQGAAVRVADDGRVAFASTGSTS